MKLCLICKKPVPLPKQRKLCSSACEKQRGSDLYLQWTRENKERHRANVARWRLKNPIKVKEQLQARYKDPMFKETALQKLQAWKQQNPQRVKLAQKINQHIRRTTKGFFSGAEWGLLVWLFQNKCAYCWKEKELTVDHIVPVSKGGSSWIENIVPACRSCNSKKHNKLDFEFVMER